MSYNEIDDLHNGLKNSYWYSEDDDKVFEELMENAALYDENKAKIEAFDEIDYLMTEAYEYYHYYPEITSESTNKKRELIQIRFAENTAKLFLKLKHESEDEEG